MFKNIKILLLVSSLTILTSCGGNNSSNESTPEVPTTSEVQEMIKQDTDIILLDVRTESEYLSGHIPNAVLLPYDQISEQAESILPNKNSKLVVYCHSGRRSAIAAKELSSLGYTTIIDFGRITNWTDELTTN